MQKVLVAMSGGVDSAVSGALLQQRGYKVTGAFIQTWHPDFLQCHWKEDRQDAMRVAAHLGIPFTTIDLEAEYKRDVADYMIAEYARGRTPNPDVMCNKHVKFGAFFRRAREMGFGAIATGHYARIRDGHLLAGVDTNKDQSYFLWTLTPDVLSRTLFPIGEMTKLQVRELARTFGLPVAQKKDSQGICFLGKVEMKDFLRHYIDLVPGPVLDTQKNIIGTHDGVLLYTIGQRHGFSITKKSPTSGPHYVVAKDLGHNTITVSEHFNESDEFAVSEIMLEDINWIAGTPPDTARAYSARFRYRQPLQECSFSLNDDHVRVTFSSPQRGIAPGQSCVIYDGDICLGGGVIRSILTP